MELSGTQCKDLLFETTISKIHHGISRKEYTCLDIIEYYINRIDKLDKTKGLNSIIALNPYALDQARYLDKEFEATGKLRPLHGIPIIVKDNFLTCDMPTTAGLEALNNFFPPVDAYIIKRLRKSGGIILAKSNMSEWAFSPNETKSSILGVTRNPYNLERVPAGSSGGTAAAIASNFGVVGLGTDTGNSIRGPAAHNCLVGIRSTMGLISRSGIIPLYKRHDIGGPLARTVEDAVRVLQEIRGYDPDDLMTKYYKGDLSKKLTDDLNKIKINKYRIGVFRYYMKYDEIDRQILDLTEKAILNLKEIGFKIIDPFVISNYYEFSANLWEDTFLDNIEEFFLEFKEYFPYKSVSDLLKRNLQLPETIEILKRKVERKKQKHTTVTESDIYKVLKNQRLIKTILLYMKEQNVDIIIYPTWSQQPQRINNYKFSTGDNSQILSPHTGFPSITVPMGFTMERLPAGLTFLGRPFSESYLFAIAYAYEQFTKHRRPPKMIL